MKNHCSGLISIQTGIRYAKKEKKKNFSLEYCSYPTRDRKFKTNRKKFKKLKNINLALFLPKLGWDRPRKRKKILVPNSIPTRPGLENSKKYWKKLNKLKNNIPTLFLSKPRWDRLRKREKYFSPEFRSNLT